MTKEEAKEHFKNLKCWSEDDVLKIIDSIDEKPFTFKEQFLLNAAINLVPTLQTYTAESITDELIEMANKIEESLKDESNA